MTTRTPLTLDDHVNVYFELHPELGRRLFVEFSEAARLYVNTRTERWHFPFEEPCDLRGAFLDAKWPPAVHQFVLAKVEEMVAEGVL